MTGLDILLAAAIVTPGALLVRRHPRAALVYAGAWLAVGIGFAATATWLVASEGWGQ